MKQTQLAHAVTGMLITAIVITVVVPFILLTVYFIGEMAVRVSNGGHLGRGI